jgi:signal transduction histidine kinase
VVQDVSLCTVVTAAVVAELVAGRASWWTVVVAAATGVALAWRRVAPAWVLGAVLVGVSILPVLEPDGEWATPFAVILVALYSGAAYDDRRRASIGLVLVLLFFAGGTVLDNILDPGRRPVGDLVYAIVLNTSAWGIGRIVRRWREQALALVERTEELERERAWREQAAVAEERNRIARELHDVISHSVTLMVVQASAAEQVLPAEAAGARESIVKVQQTGREAVEELRRMLGVLRPTEHAPCLDPQPALRDLPSMVARAAGAGVRADVRITGPERELPPGVELVAYRVVQEALTNVVKHAGPTTASVRLAYGDDALAIEVVNGPAVGGRAVTDGAGQGLLGMRERLALYGGHLDAGPCGQGYAVRARVPFSGTPA